MDQSKPADARGPRGRPDAMATRAPATSGDEYNLLYGRKPPAHRILEPARHAAGIFDETQLRHLERTTVLGTPSGYIVAVA